MNPKDTIKLDVPLFIRLFEYATEDAKDDMDLHRIKWLLDEIMADAPTFTGEDEFLKEHEQTKMWRTLSK